MGLVLLIVLIVVLANSHRPNNNCGNEIYGLLWLVLVVILILTLLGEIPWNGGFRNWR